MKLNLASGAVRIEGFKNVDISPAVEPDFIVDLEQVPWGPFESNSVQEIMCSHYIEHTSDLIKFMDECWRILKPGAQMKVWAPYYTSVRCWQDPTHKRAISESSFYYFNKDWRVANRLEHYAIKCDFDFNYSYILDSVWLTKSEEQRAFAMRHFNNVISDINVTLTKKAPADEPAS